MGSTTHSLKSEVYLTVLIRDKYLEALERDPNVSIKQLIADFIEEYLNKYGKSPIS